MGRKQHDNRGSVTGFGHLSDFFCLTYHKEETPVLHELLAGLAWLSHVPWCDGRHHQHSFPSTLLLEKRAGPTVSLDVFS